MRFSSFCEAALLVTVAIAAPSRTEKEARSVAITLPSTLPTSLAQLLSWVKVTSSTTNSSAGAALPSISPVSITPSSKNYHHKLTLPSGYTSGKYVNWTTFKGMGANIGGWLEKEANIDPFWWDSFNISASDEWTLCEKLGKKCGAAFEERYASFFTLSDIDVLGSAGVNVIRIPTTYAAWIKFPGSQLYHGKQQEYLRIITDYAIARYNMHVIIGLHSLPGGVNSLPIGEALFHDSWFFNTTNLYYSFKAASAVLNFIETSGFPNAFTFAPINEASDNFAGFATPAGLTTAGGKWVAQYIQGVINIFGSRNKKIPIMLQDCFLGETYWSPFFASSTNLVIDSHVYYFAASGIYSQYVAPAICGQASTLAGDGKFPVFVGEFSLQTLYNNTLAGRKQIYDTQVYAWNKYVSGGSFWTSKGYYGNQSVDGEGVLEDYWSFEVLVQDGVVTGTALNSSYC